MEEQHSILQKLETIERLVAEQNLLRKDMLSFEEACNYLQLKPSCLYKMTSGRSLPFYRPGGKRIYFKRSELDQWLQTNRKVANHELEARAEDYIIRTLKTKK